MVVQPVEIPRELGEWRAYMYDNGRRTKDRLSFEKCEHLDAELREYFINSSPMDPNAAKLADNMICINDPKAIVRGAK